MNKYGEMVIKRRKILYPKYEEYYACTCGGEYHQTGVTYATYPAIVEYKCDRCGKIIEIRE